MGRTMATQKPNIPALRFPEFKGDWKLTCLGDLCRSISSGKTKPEANGNYPVYGSTGEFGRTEDYTYEGEYILVARVGANAGLLNKVSGLFGVTDNTLVLDLIDKRYLQFIYFVLKKTNLNTLVFGSGQPLITGGQLKSQKFFMPQDHESKKIADFLTAVDQKIAQLTKKKSCLEQYKKGVMQCLFTQRLRFPDTNGNPFPDWEEKCISEIGDVITGKTPSTDDDSLWDGDIAFITPTDLSDDTKYQTNANRKVALTKGMRVLPANSILYTCIASIGKMAINTVPCITNQQINSIVPFNYFNNEFVFYAVSYISPKIKKTQANTTLPIINKTEFSKFTISIPSPKEQQKIADFLSAIDTKITVLGNQLTAAQDFKKSLLQKMFV